MRGSFGFDTKARSPLRVLAGFATAALAVLWIAGAYSTEVVGAILSAIQIEIAALDRDFAILSLDIHEEGPAHTIRLRADVAHTLFVHGKSIRPFGARPGEEGWYQVHIAVGGAIQSTLLFLIAVLGWPASSLRELLVRTSLAIPMIVFLTALDLPVALLGNLQEVVARQVDPKEVVALFAWDKWLEGGGDFALAVAAAVAVITKGRSWSKPGPTLPQPTVCLRERAPVSRGVAPEGDSPAHSALELQPRTVSHSRTVKRAGEDS